MKLVNPAPFGLIALAVTTGLMGLLNAGWSPSAHMGLVLAMAFVYGGSMQIVTGIAEFARGNTFGLVAFSSYGVFWLSFALLVHFLFGGARWAFMGTYLFVWGMFSLYLWCTTFGLPRILQLVFLALCSTFLVLAAGHWTVSALLTHLGGYLGLLTALLLAYACVAEVINEKRGREVLPVGAPVTGLSG